MKIFSPRTLLAAALLTALPMGSALACTTSAWSSATPNASAGDPTEVARYSGTCALKADAAGTSYVTDNTPGNEPIYRARFYVYTGSATSGSKIFAATSDDDGGGTEAFSVSVDGGALAFAVNGTTVSTTVPVVAQKWYGVEALYRAGGQFEAKVRGNASPSEVSVVSAGNAGSVNVGSARLGVLSATSNAVELAFDAFESTRSEATSVGWLCRGEVTGDGLLNVGDVSTIINEALGNSFATGQPDATEDGLVNVGDVSTVISLILSGDDECAN
ncbi:MAG: hypothetical protein WCY72_03455 [Lysobacteraceae bacterium]